MASPKSQSINTGQGDSVSPGCGGRDGRYRRARARGRAASWRSPPRRRRTRRWPRWRRRCARARPGHPRRQCRGRRRRQGRRRDRGLPRPADARRQARRRDGGRARRGARAARSGRHGDRALDAAERHDDRAGARAARRGRRHLREPAERDRRCRRALPEGRQCRDPARRLGQLPLVARDPCRAGRGPARAPACRRTRSSSCRRATAPRSA